MDAACDVFAAAGFAVARNAPFAGGYITQTYGRPQIRQHALQIEVDRSLYMDEGRVEKRPEFGEIRGMIGAALRELVRLGPRAVPLAAE
jgi:N-formylglutamate deformylase